MFRFYPISGSSWNSHNEVHGTVPSPSGRERRDSQRADTQGEGRKSMQILRPSPCPLPEGEGKSRRAYSRWLLGLLFDFSGALLCSLGGLVYNLFRVIIYLRNQTL